MLVCTVRDCRLPLLRTDRQMVCARGHSFDVARTGYLNLLQPQERRSKAPGDSVAAVAGRRRVYDLGVAAPLLAGIAEASRAEADDVVLDAGCGDGYYLGSLTGLCGCRGHGVDISIPAVEAAARRYPACEWVVANADRFVPYSDGAFSLVLSITARMNPGEFRRILRADGRLLVALPAPDDLIELRGSGREDRVDRTVADFAADFALIQQERVSTSADLDADTVAGLLRSIYRPAAAGGTVDMRVTFSLDLLLFRVL